MRHATVALLTALLAFTSSAGTVFTLDRAINPTDYRIDAPVLVTLTITLDTAGSVNSIGVEETVPPGWRFQGIASGITPIVKPTTGKDGLLEFAWFPLPPLPTFSFTYELALNESSVGTQAITGRGIAFIDQQETLTPVEETLAVRDGSGTPHNADQNDNFILSLSELLRVVQFFTLGSYSCPLDPSFTEDGYFAGSDGTQTCPPHNSDFESPANYAISLNELLRLIQLYNTGTYHSCDDPPTDDGFCTGPPD
jgi:hypothetical protein